ncbi:hypothetical protein [Pseudoalteromonas sp. JSTW]|uniref:hypothetical protein n=1 Tax=Pseudoalteromonas sp. JSTW TaxID=2752475 RepID=UPI0015D53397|nr:hypothetical protein [Pseudoalteromonas sp. JSTW]QLJ09010.1 hypothetical protein GZH31_03905 [Pseudoalteromonas sp. JSTW]
MHVLNRVTLTKLVTCSVLSIALLSACKSTKSEHQQYTELQRSFSYEAYSGVSDTSVDTIAYGYKTLQKERLKQVGEIEPTLTHAMMSYILSMGLSNDFAIAESDLALAKAIDIRGKYLAYSAQSLAFYNKGWRKMAKQKADFIRTDPLFKTVSQSYPKEQLISYLIIGSVAVRDGDLATVQNMFYVIGEQIEKPWLPSLAKAITVTLNGSMLESLVMLKDISTDPSLNAYEQAKISELIGIAGSKLSDKNKRQQITRITDDFFLDRIKDNSVSLYRDLITNLQKYTDQVL